MLSKRGRATFFPDDWSADEVIDEVKSAYDNAKPTRAGKWRAASTSGVEIEGFADAKGNICFAWPSLQQTGQPEVDDGDN